MDWFRFYHGALDDPKVQRLDPVTFRLRFLAAVAGESNEFSAYLKPGYDRPLARDWAILRSFVFARDDYTCEYCGERGGRLECDHVVPVSRGGSHDPSNLVTACFRCNRAKYTRTPEEWLA